MILSKSYTTPIIKGKWVVLVAFLLDTTEINLLPKVCLEFGFYQRYTIAFGWLCFGFKIKFKGAYD